MLRERESIKMSIGNMLKKKRENEDEHRKYVKRKREHKDEYRKYVKEKERE